KAQRRKTLLKDTESILKARPIVRGVNHCDLLGERNVPDEDIYPQNSAGIDTPRHSEDVRFQDRTSDAVSTFRGHRIQMIVEPCIIVPIGIAKNLVLDHERI